jgi:hypothetical protein
MAGERKERGMRYVLMTFVAKQRVEEWEAASSEERRALIDDTLEWFRTYSSKGWIAGGAELGWPKGAKTVRRKGVTDGPFLETKELLGGFIIVDVPGEAEALEMAAAWPGLVYDDDVVEVRPEGDSAGEA